MRKIIAILLTMGLCLSLLAGCQLQKKEEITTITLWHYYSANIKTEFDNMVQEFNETVGKEKGIIVDAYAQGGVNELADAVLAAANKDVGADKMPDIFSAYSDSVYRLDQLGVIAEIGNYFTEEELSSYRKEFLEDGRLGIANGPIKIIPIAKSTELLFVESNLFEEFAADTGASLEDLQTWEGLAETAEKYYEWSGGSALFGIDSLSNFIIQGTKQLGEDIFEVENGVAKFNLSKENARKIWDVYAIPMIKGHFAAVGRFRADDVKSGTIIGFTGSNSSASYFPQEIQSGKETSRPTQVRVMPYPHFEGKDRYSVHQGAGMAVAKTTEDREKACAEFLKWFTESERNLKFAVGTAYLPVKNEALTYEKTVQVLGTEDENEIMVQTAKALYEMLGKYTLYANAPFEKSYDARNIVNNSLSDYITQVLKEMEESGASGQEKQTLIEQYLDEAHFETWYQGICDQMAQLLQ